MARKFAPFWEKLKADKEIVLNIEIEDNDVDIHELAEKVRVDMARCKSEDHIYKRDFPGSKLKLTINPNNSLTFTLDEKVYVKGMSVRLEDI